MTETTASEEALQAACQLVGRFLYHFSLLERELDNGIGKLLGIEPGAIDIVTANMDFARKVKIIFSAEVFKAEMPDDTRKKLLAHNDSLSATFIVWLAIMALNEDRKIVAHCPFSPGTGKDTSVVFRRAVTTKTRRLKVKDEKWSDHKFEGAFARATEATANLKRIIEEVVPYKPKLDFRDPRNSKYVAIIL